MTLCRRSERRQHPSMTWMTPLLPITSVARQGRSAAGGVGDTERSAPDAEGRACSVVTVAGFGSAITSAARTLPEHHVVGQDGAERRAGQQLLLGQFELAQGGDEASLVGANTVNGCYRQVVGESGGDQASTRPRSSDWSAPSGTMVGDAGRHQHLVDDVDHAVAGCDVGRRDDAVLLTASVSFTPLVVSRQPASRARRSG